MLNLECRHSRSMQSEVSICGAGAVGLYMAISSNLTSGFDFRLHSLSRGGTFENLKFEKSGEIPLWRL